VPVTDSRARRRTAALLCAAAVLLAVAAMTAFPVWEWGSENWMNPAHLLVVGRVFDHPFALGSGAAVLLGLAAVVALNHTRTRIGIAVVATALLGLTVVGAGVAAVTGYRRAVTRYPSLDGRYEVVVESHGQVQGPVWLLFLQTRQGLFSRRHYLGCMDGDNEDFAFGSAQWTGPHTVRVAEGDGRTFDVTIGNDGTPDHTVGSKDACYRL
jgi:hypothetical protein